MNCIYHSVDLDGYCSAAIVKKWHEQNTRSDKGELKLIGWNYGQPIPELDGEPVIMVDVSFPPEVMLEVSKNCKGHLTWIDHHVSAIKDMCEFMIDKPPFLTHVTDTKFAACELTWTYLFSSPPPAAVQLLGMYDSWRDEDKEKWNNVVMPFQYGMRSICNSVNTFPMEYLEFKDILPLINTGDTILRYQKQQNKGLCRLAFERKFKGLRAICINVSGENSQTFESAWDESKHDLMLAFYYNGNHDQYTVSLYSTKPEVDCSVLAKSMGGGGHKGAAGFQVKEFKTIFDN